MRGIRFSKIKTICKNSYIIYSTFFKNRIIGIYFISRHWNSGRNVICKCAKVKIFGNESNKIKFDSRENKDQIEFR
jgi:hypothetical protein